MTMLRVENDRQNALGHARIIIEGMQPPADCGFHIMREGYAAANLGRRGWQIQEEKLRPVSTLQEGANTVIIIGPALTRHLEPGPLVFVLPGVSLETSLFWPDDIDVFDGDLPPETALPAEPEPPKPPLITPIAAPPPPPPMATPPSAPQAAPVPLAATREATTAPNRVPIFAGVAILLAVLAAAGFWFYGQDNGASAPAPQLAETPRAPSPAAASAPIVTERPWLERTDTMALRDLVQSAPDAAAIFTAALRRQAAGRHDDALVLFEEAGERGHAPALTALARLYDPNGFIAGRPFRNPDPRAAARYYRDATQKGDEAAAAPRAILKSHLEELARAGNGTAETALKEFWP